MRDLESHADSEGAARDIGDDEPVVTGQSEADAAARRAFNAAVVGFGTCPGIAHLYSLAVAFDLDRSVLSERGRRKWTWAVALDSVALVGVVAVIVARLM